MYVNYCGCSKRRGTWISKKTVCPLKIEQNTVFCGGNARIKRVCSSRPPNTHSFSLFGLVMSKARLFTMPCLCRWGHLVMLSYAKTKARLVYVWNTCNQKCCLSDGCCLEVFQWWGCSKSENFKGEIFRDCFVRRFARCAAGVRKVCPVGIKPTPKISPPAGQKGCLI